MPLTTEDGAREAGDQCDLVFDATLLCDTPMCGQVTSKLSTIKKGYLGPRVYGATWPLEGDLR